MSVFTKIKEAVGISLDSYIEKSKHSIKALNEVTLDRKSFQPLDLNDGLEMGYKERTSGITFEILRRMAIQNAVVASIIQTYVLKVKNYSQPQPDKYSPGFKIVLRDEKAESDEDHDVNIKAIENWILNTGSDEGRAEEDKMSFTDFLSLLTRDVLTYDQLGIETINNKAGKLAYFLPVSGGSIRHASESLSKRKLDKIVDSPMGGFSENQVERESRLLENDKERDQEAYKYVQVYGHKLVRGFYEDELILKMMNPTNEIDSNGYSTGPLEMAVNIVSYHLFSEAHNKMFFTQGFASRGILHLKGDVPKHHLASFKKEWHERVSSTANAWRTPIFAGAETDLQWIPLSESNRDMEWSAWVEYLLKILTALFSIAPQEINFDITRSSGTAFGDSGAKNESQMKHSRDKGLKPLLEFYESIINESLLKRFDEKLYKIYKFQFVGIDSETKQSEFERQKEEVKLFKTINEIRAEYDMKPLAEGGEIILDSNWMQWYVNFSKDAKEKAKVDQEANQAMMGAQNPDDEDPSQKDPFAEDDATIDELELDNEDDPKSVEDSINELTTKSLKKFQEPKLLKVMYYKK